MSMPMSDQLTKIHYDWASSFCSVPNLAPPDGGALADYEEDYAKGQAEFSQKQAAGNAGLSAGPASPAAPGPDAPQQGSGQPAPLDLSHMSAEDKLIEAYHRAKLGPAMASEIERLVTPQALVTALLSFAGVFVVSQLTPVGWAADIGIAITGIFVGSVLFDAIQELIAFADARNARSEPDLDVAGEHFARAFGKVSVNALIILVTHGSGKGGGGAEPFDGPSPNGFADVVTDQGLIVRMPAEAAAATTIAPAQAAALGAAAAPAAVAMTQSGGGGGPSSSSTPSGPNQSTQAPPPTFKDKPGFQLTDFDKETAGTGGIRSINKGADVDGLYEVTIEGELKDPIPREQAPNYNASDKLIDPEGPGLDPKAWEKSHAVGPGFGDEAAAGLMEAPKDMNQLFQNRGVEGWMRDLYQLVKTRGGKVTYKVSVAPWKFPTPAGWSPTSGAEFLRSASYRVQVEFPGAVSQPPAIEISIDTAAPPSARVMTVSIEPPGAINPADFLGN
jgi:hypothetical protein